MEGEKERESSRAAPSPSPRYTEPARCRRRSRKHRSPSVSDSLPARLLTKADDQSALEGSCRDEFCLSRLSFLRMNYLTYDVGL